MCPMIYYETVKVRRDDLLKEAEKERLIKIAQAGQPSLGDQIQLKIGQGLIKIGGRFYERPDSQSTQVRGTLES
ncbi:MAG: hypothetical protein MUO76_21780 [Anaerolineaceae bacterium]|nr:hypothetical protein [Anaerolineaceae bacterium]